MTWKRFEFNDIFQTLGDGSLELKQPIQVGPSIYDTGTLFKQGIATGGIDFHLYKGRGIAVEQEENSEGPLQLKGFYSD